MMTVAIQIIDGRSSLYRYDTGVRIRILGCNNITECHFEVPDGVIRREVSADNVVAVPDAALLVPGLLRMYVYDRTATGAITRHALALIVNDRPKPADYIDPPDEVESLDLIANRVAEILGPTSGGGITEEKDPTVPAWAKQPTKPTYNAQEVGALPANTKIPSATSELLNDNGFVTKSVSDLVNYYQKSETYTRDEINQRISAIPKFSISVVSTLPATGISETTIYLVGGGENSDLYTEYIFVDGAWEILGSQRVDLTGYATENWVSDQLGSYLKESELQLAINKALSQAVSSGEFKGDPGEPGKDGIDGQPGKDGKDGVSVTHVWNGTTLTVTSASGTSSADLKGETGTAGKDGQPGKDGTSVTVKGVSESSADGGNNVVTFSDGTTMSVKNGSKGSTGEKGDKGDTGEQGIQGIQGIQGVKGDKGDTGEQGPVGADGAKGDKGDKGDPGHTPERGVDYWTPADQESIVQQVVAAQNMTDYVKTEADSVIDRVMNNQTSGRVFTIAAISDMHYGSGNYPDGVHHAAQALGYIADRIGIDSLAVMGDYTDLYIESDYANGMADVQTVNALLSDIGAETMAIVGNHDFHATASPKLARALLGKSNNVVWGSRTGGYYYRDYDDYKLRIICLNTSEQGNNNITCSTAQYAWFASTLDMSAKEDAAEWQLLILSHHPLDWYEGVGDGVFRFAHILDAYVNGKSWSGGGISCDFAGKNAARIICNVHGHLHNLKVDKIHLGNASTSETTIDVYRMCMPESCFDRPQSYGSVWNTETTYVKTANSAADTTFTVLCIDLENYAIKAINYGAGVDRQLIYYDPTAPKYTNMLLQSVGSDGTPFNGGQGWISGYRINSAGQQVENADYCVTGFIPIKDRDTLYLENMNFVVGGTDTQPNTRVCTYNASFATLHNVNVGDVPGSTIFNAMLLDENGGPVETGDAIGRMRIDAYNDNVAYIRFSTKKIDATSVVTVNEPIV